MASLFATAYAHGGVGMVDNRCVLRIGPDVMFFTGYHRKIPEKSFVTMFQTLGKRLSRSICKKPSSATCSREIRLIKDDGAHTQMNGLPFLTDTELANKAALDAVGIASRQRNIRRAR